MRSSSSPSHAASSCLFRFSIFASDCFETASSALSDFSSGRSFFFFALAMAVSMAFVSSLDGTDEGMETGPGASTGTETGPFSWTSLMANSFSALATL
ncbi:hypothetical protein TrVE_jg5926 [Triparma verrucosa]|uniref:Uncharacterized protein n=1 Tax=Triparma verrucosa TaxID=1606542 RepID=A0A9W7BDT1_9STRA|nr:hypothetical protein TrVE_jg5926 [Triparma verrucosa]